MVDSVRFPPSIGGSGKTFTSDANPQTGVFNGGHRINFFPMLADTVAAAGYVSQYAQAIDGAAANADRAENARGYVEAVADQYRVNITEQLRRKSSLYLNFEEGVYQFDAGARFITTNAGDVGAFTRASDKRVAGPNGRKRVVPGGELARFWRNGHCKGFLSEPARTNSALYSADYTQSVWSKNGVTIEGGQADPYGTYTAQKLVETNGLGFHSILQELNINEGEYWGLSFSVLPIEKTRFQARIGGAAFEYAQLTYNAATGQIEFLTPGVGVRVHEEANGFTRISIKLPAAIATGTGNFSLHLASTVDGSSSYQGDGQSGAIITEPQFEQVEERGWPSSHIPTTDAPASRTFDNLNVDVSDYLPGHQGTLFVRFVNSVSNQFASPIQLNGSSQTTKNARFELFVRSWVLGGLGTNETLPSLPESTAENYSTAISWSDGEIISAGAGVATSPRGLSGPVGLELRVGRSYNTSTTVFNDGIMEVMLLPFALEADVLAALTAEGV